MYKQVLFSVPAVYQSTIRCFFLFQLSVSLYNQVLLSVPAVYQSVQSGVAFCSSCLSVCTIRCCFLFQLSVSLYNQVLLSVPAVCHSVQSVCQSVQAGVAESPRESDATFHQSTAAK